MSDFNNGINFGHSSKMIYDQNYLNDQTKRSTGPLQYKLNNNPFYNCEQCLTNNHPGKSKNSYLNKNQIDIESILSNRVLKANKQWDSKYNPYTVSKLKKDFDQNNEWEKSNKVCKKNKLEPISTKLSNSNINLREVSLNRFLDLPMDSQKNIYWNRSINTQLEARDNYKEKIPKLKNYDPTLPNPNSRMKKEWTC